MQAYVYGDNFVIKGVRRDLYDFFEQLKGYVWPKNEGVLGQILDKETCGRWCA